MRLWGVRFPIPREFNLGMTTESAFRDSPRLLRFSGPLPLPLTESRIRRPSEVDSRAPPGRRDHHYATVVRQSRPTEGEEAEREDEEETQAVVEPKGFH